MGFVRTKNSSEGAVALEADVSLGRVVSKNNSEARSALGTPCDQDLLTL